MEFSDDSEMKAIAGLAQEFYRKILDDMPLFVSDEANILDVSGDEPEEIISRISKQYGKSIGMTDLKQPLWKLIRQLSESPKEKLV
jgi:hypothetical protein